VDKTPVSGLPNFDYLTMTGAFSIFTTHVNKCNDGTINVATNTDVKIDNTKGTVVEGQLAINAIAVAVYNADDSLTVNVNGG